MKLAYKTTANYSSPYERAVDNDADDGTPAPVWWRANFDAVMEDLIIPAVGDALGMQSLERRKEIKALRERVAKLERELEQARADSVVTLPRSAWRYNAA